MNRLKTKRIKSGVYQIVGTELTVEKDDLPKKWGDPFQIWVICKGEIVLAECRGKQGCINALENIFAELSKGEGK